MVDEGLMTRSDGKDEKDLLGHCPLSADCPAEDLLPHYPPLVKIAEEDLPNHYLLSVDCIEAKLLCNSPLVADFTAVHLQFLAAQTSSVDL